MAQTGQSDAIHSPEACARTVVRLMIPAPLSIEGVCTRGDLMLAQDLADDIELRLPRRLGALAPFTRVAERDARRGFSKTEPANRYSRVRRIWSRTRSKPAAASL